jgi:D-glycero-D-manno-heptose 1,7-bisphosphate phosphatase
VLDYAADAIRRLNEQQIPAVAITNQPGVHKGLFDLKGLYEINSAIQERLAEYGASLDAVFFCPHAAPTEGDDIETSQLCKCRKPKPGMVNLALTVFGAAKSRTLLFGDFESDILAAERAGVVPVYIETMHDEHEDVAEMICRNHTETYDNRRFSNLRDAVELFEK